MTVEVQWKKSQDVGKKSQGIKLVQLRVGVNGPRGKRYSGRFHKVTRRHSIPLWRKQNLKGILSSRKVNRQHRNTRVRLICRIRRQGRVTSVTNWLRCPESGSTRWVDNLNLQLLRSDSQIGHSPICIGRCVCVHPPLKACSGRDLVLEQNLCAFVQHPNAAGEGRPISPPTVRTRFANEHDKGKTYPLP